MGINDMRYGLETGEKVSVLRLLKIYGFPARTASPLRWSRKFRHVWERALIEKKFLGKFGKDDKVVRR